MYYRHHVLLIWLSLWLSSAQAAVTLEECQDLVTKDLRQSLVSVVQTSIQNSSALKPDETHLRTLWNELKVDETIAAEFKGASINPRFDRARACE